MAKLFILNLFFFLFIIVLSLLLIYFSNLGFLGLRLKIYCNTNSIAESFLLLIIIFCFIMFIIHLLFTLLYYFSIDLASGPPGPAKFDYLFVTDNNQDLDHVRWWPSGTPQTWGVIGSAVAVYRTVPGNTKVKATAAVASLGISVPFAVWFHAVENPNGFNKLMYSMMEFKRTGIWPSKIPNQVSDENLNPIIENAVKESIEKYEKMRTSGSSSSSFLPTDNLSDIFSPDYLIKYIFDLFRPVPVEGYLDDLIGQQIFIHILLMCIVISLIFLFTIFIFIVIMVQNKDFIIKRFNNKIIRFYLKYQYMLSKISIFILPIFILLGLIELAIGLHYLISHPIPWELLPLDLHTYVKKT